MLPIKNETGRQIMEKAYIKKNVIKLIYDVNATWL